MSRIVLKGQSAEIKVPAVAQFSEIDADSFVVVVRRGNDKELTSALEWAKSGDMTNRGFLDTYVIRLENLIGADGMPVNGSGVVQWIKEGEQARQEPLTENEQERLELIDTMLQIPAYTNALINATFSGVANRLLHNAQRLGN